MAGWLIAATGVAYFVVGCDMVRQHKIPEAIIWWGYSFSQIGLWIVSTR
jgi:hypothetical protein